MTSTREADALATLHKACSHAGLDPGGHSTVRLGENAIYRLADATIVRITRPGQAQAAEKEVRVAQWLASINVPAVEVMPGITQPLLVSQHAVTFWRELPPHRNGTPAEVATALRRLHDATPPTTFTLPEISPFVRLEDRIRQASSLTPADRAWLRSHLDDLRHRYASLPPGLPRCVIHGDAWIGNVVAAEDGRVVLLDLERVAWGPPEWDLVHTAIKSTSFGWINGADCVTFCTLYGHDVTQWTGFELLRDIREFRMTCMAAQVAAENAASHTQATHRLACLRGEHGPRPWPGWHPVP